MSVHLGDGFIFAFNPTSGEQLPPVKLLAEVRAPNCKCCCLLGIPPDESEAVCLLRPCCQAHETRLHNLNDAMIDDGETVAKAEGITVVDVTGEDDRGRTILDMANTIDERMMMLWVGSELDV